MDERREQENELQSRREFFKNAAKSTLPVLGLTLLATFPMQNSDALCLCSGGCTGCSGCYTNCYGSEKVDD